MDTNAWSIRNRSTHIELDKLEIGICSYVQVPLATIEDGFLALTNLYGSSFLNIIRKLGIFAPFCAIIEVGHRDVSHI